MDIFAFALAFLALGFAAVAWTTCASLARASKHQALWTDGTVKSLQARLVELEKRPTNTPVAQLRAEVGDLAAAVDELRLSTRKQYGKLWRRQQLEEGVSTSPGGTSTGDDEIDAMIRLQGAPPAGSR